MKTEFQSFWKSVYIILVWIKSCIQPAVKPSAGTSCWRLSARSSNSWNFKMESSFLEKDPGLFFSLYFRIFFAASSLFVMRDISSCSSTEIRSPWRKSSKMLLELTSLMRLLISVNNFSRCFPWCFRLYSRRVFVESKPKNWNKGFKGIILKGFNFFQYNLRVVK